MFTTETRVLSKSDLRILSQIFLCRLERSQGYVLHWTQPKRLQTDYVLRSKDHIFGTLKYEENHFIRRAVATTAEVEWRFKYTRFSLPKVTIQQKNDLLAETIMETNWGSSGHLLFAGDCHYGWKSTNDAETEYHFFTPEGRSLVFFRPRFGFLKFEAETEIDPVALQNPHIPLLLMLGWFLLLIRLR